MWTQTYDRHGSIVNGGWTHLEEAIKGEHQPIIKVDMLDASLNSFGKYILSTGQGGSELGNFTDVVSDGSIDVDYDRGTRRTAELTLLNPSAEFTPTTAGYESEGEWSGLFYINRIVRIWRGANTNHGELYVPVGTFMIDAPEIIVEENMSLANLTMSDLWKKLTKSFYGYNKKYVKGTLYNTIIKDLLDSAGVPRTGKYAANLSALAGRDLADRKTTNAVKFSIGDSRGERLKELVKAWNIDAYFDPLGVFKTEDRESDRSKAVRWTFESKSIDNKGQNGGLVSLTRSFNDDNLYNHVIIIGTGNEKNTVKASRSITRETSKFNIATIGDRVFLKESDKIGTQAQANKALERIWAKKIQFSETINAEVICNPGLEADDKIRIIEGTHALVNDTFRLRKFNVPLITSKQTIEVTNTIRDEDLWG